MSTIAIGAIKRPTNTTEELEVINIKTFEKAQNLIVAFLDGEITEENTVLKVGKYYPKCFSKALLLSNYAKVKLGKLIRLNTKAKRLTNFEKQYYRIDEEDEVTISMLLKTNNEQEIRKLTIKR